MRLSTSTTIIVGMSSGSVIRQKARDFDVPSISAAS